MTPSNTAQLPATIAYSQTIARNFDLERKIEPARLDAILRVMAGNDMVHHEEGKVLDLGCGTGFFTIPLAQRLPCQFTGADRSKAMLSCARDKKEGRDLDINWDIQEATSLNYEAESFDVVFVSNLLHHFMNPLDVIEQCAKVLKPGGLLINHYGALEDIIKDADHKFFPAAVELDVRRTPARIQMEYLFKTAGFENIKSEKKTYKLCTSAQERVKLVENKYISVFHMMNEMDFQRGLKEMRRYSEQNQFDPWLRELETTTTFGIKR